MTVSRALAFLAIALFAVPAAAQQAANPRAPLPEGPPKKEPKIFPLGQSWLATSLNGKAYPSGADRPAFTLDKQFTAKGFGGCNTFRAVAYPLKEQGLAVGPFALTKNACSKELMATEQAFLFALREAEKWDVVAGQLVIQGRRGELKFDRSI